jgi:transposase
MNNLKKHTQEASAAKAGMDVKTARKYIKAGKLPSELKKQHTWMTHKDAFTKVWPEIEMLLESSPGLQAKTVLHYLQQAYPGEFKDSQLRTLQRRFRNWRSEHGSSKAVIFLQEHEPGCQSQSDYTNMNDLNITIHGEPFNHLLFHFMLVYSRWEYVEICYSESFDSLVHGYENAVWTLGYVAKEHRTDNLSAATKRYNSSRTFTENWQKVMDHYDVKPSRNNPGESHENGSIEKSHDLVKTCINQHLLLRGSRDFESIAAYKEFIIRLIDNRNKSRQELLSAEIPSLKELPADKWYTPKTIPVRVSPSSTIQVLGIPYSVPSRLISYSLRAEVYPNKIELFYGNRYIQNMVRLTAGFGINYRHIIDSLIRKPGAFEHYQYRAALFPSIYFKQSYDILRKKSAAKGHKYYLKLLHLAKTHGEQNVEMAIKLLLEEGGIPLPDKIKELLDLPVAIPQVHVKQPSLAAYDELREEC